MCISQAKTLTAAPCSGLQTRGMHGACSTVLLCTCQVCLRLQKGDFNVQEMSPEDMEEALKQGIEAQAGEGEGQQIEMSMEMDQSQPGNESEGDGG